MNLAGSVFFVYPSNYNWKLQLIYIQMSLAQSCRWLRLIAFFHMFVQSADPKKECYILQGGIHIHSLYIFII